MTINNEIWKDIQGYEGKYQVSNLGRVRSVARPTFSNGKPYRSVSTKILTLHAPMSKSGKPRLSYIATGSDKQLAFFSVHRVVAEAFIPNPLNHTRIIFKDANLHNAKADNLEWASDEEYERWSKRTGLVVIKRRKKGEKREEKKAETKKKRINSVHRRESLYKGDVFTSYNIDFKFRFYCEDTGTPEVDKNCIDPFCFSFSLTDFLTQASLSGEKWKGLRICQGVRIECSSYGRFRNGNGLILPEGIRPDSKTFNRRGLTVLKIRGGLFDCFYLQASVWGLYSFAKRTLPNGSKFIVPVPRNGNRLDLRPENIILCKNKDGQELIRAYNQKGSVEGIHGQCLELIKTEEGYQARMGNF